MTVDLLSPVFPSWTRLEPPTESRPYWHETDGTRHTVSELLLGADATTTALIERSHTEAIGQLVGAASQARRRGEWGEARRLANAAARLCQEVIGLWPISASATHQ